MGLPPPICFAAKPTPPQNEPLYLKSFGEEESQFHFMVHAALDVFEEKGGCPLLL